LHLHRVSIKALHFSLCLVWLFGVSFVRHFISSTFQVPFYTLPFSVSSPAASELQGLHLECYLVSVMAIMQLVATVTTIMASFKEGIAFDS
jgi:hypothetical protein